MHTFVIPVAPSVTEAVATLVTPNEYRTEHSITVTCTVRPESDADVCVVMAMADGIMTRSSKYVRSYIMNAHTICFLFVYICTYMYVCTHVCIYECIISQNCTYV